MALRSQANAGDSLKTVALHLLAEGKRELGRDVRVPSSKRASEPETNMWTSPVPSIEQFHRKFPAITRALVLAQPETTSDEDTDDGSARVGTIENSEDARRVLKHARYVRPLDLDTAKEDTSEDDAASASGDSTPAASAAPSPGGEGKKEIAARPNDADAARSVSREPKELTSPAVVGPAVAPLDPRESVDPERAAVEPSPADAKGFPRRVSRTPCFRTKIETSDRVERREKPNPRFGFPDAASRAEAWRRGFRAWREKRGIDPSAKVFIVVGSYSDARASLLRRGWVENEERDSPYFHLKWTTRARDVSKTCRDEETRLREKTWRRPNHGKGTTRGFGSAAGDPTEVAKLQAAAFLTDVTKKKLGIAPEPKHPSFLADDRAADKKKDVADASRRVELFPGQTVNHFVGAAAHLTTKAGLCRSLALHARWRGVGDVACFFPRCYDLSADHDETRAFECDFEYTLARSALRRALRDGGLRADGVATETALRVALRVCEHQAEYEESLVRAHASDDVPARTPLDETERAALRECPAFRPRRANVSETNDEQNRNRSSSAPLSRALREACVAALDVLDRANPQASMEGDCGVWILKPAGKSRGRGIGCVTSLEQARRHVLAGSQGPFEQRRRAWVAQKYIERPLLIRGRKFDVRVWVFVTGVAPLRVWMWREPYLRFCAEEYALDDVSNVFRHLSNNAVAAHSPAHATQAMGEGNMWRLENFKAFLRSTRAERVRARTEARGGREGGGGGLGSSDTDLEHVSKNDHDPFVDEWETSLEPQMRAAAVATLACAEDGLESGGATSACQLFGYDFVIDEHMKVWLLEVNSSPCMEHSTPVTADLCPRAFDDAFEVLEDDRRRGEEAALPLGATRGGWELVHVGAPGDDRAAAASGAAKWGVDLTVKGDASVYQREAQRFRKQAQTADAARANEKPGCAVIRTGFGGGADAGDASGLPRAPAWEPAWVRLSKAHTRSSMAGRTVRVK